MNTKAEFIKAIDDQLHALDDAPEPWRSMADKAHGDLHDLAALISDNAEIRASVGAPLRGK